MDLFKSIEISAENLVRAKRKLILSVLILDASGSMQVYGKTPQEAVNTHLLELAKDTEQEHFCAVVTFNDRPELKIPFTEASKKELLHSYNAEGNTLLWETVAMVLKGLEYRLLYVYRVLPPEYRHKLIVSVGVFSDGEDNKSYRSAGALPPISAEWSGVPKLDKGYPELLRETVERVSQYPWKLHAYGIGIDGKKLASDMGFPEDLSLTVEASKEGLMRASGSFSTSTQGFRI